MKEKVSADNRVREIRRKTRKKYSSEEKVRIVLEGLRGEESIAALCRREGIPSNLYYRWSKEFLEAGRKRLAGDTKREATSSEVTELRQENEQLKQAVAAPAFEPGPGSHPGCLRTSSRRARHSPREERAATIAPPRMTRRPGTSTPMRAV